MGLSGPKKKTKIGQDPNNTTWSRSTDRFGHRLLVAQGWTPGSNLGVANASPSVHHGPGSSSHIRVLLKDDNRGLGAKRVGETAETFGLNVFQGLLGRLNGQSDEELRREQDAQMVRRQQLYHARRWGHVNFISGGFLARDDLDPPVAGGESHRELPATQASVRRLHPPRSETKSLLLATGSGKHHTALPSSARDKDADVAPTAISTPSDDKAERRRQRAERKLRREERRLKKEQRQNQRSSEAQNSNAVLSQTTSSEAKTPVKHEESLPMMASDQRTRGRLAARRRYIDQKKKASQNSQALKEIFMIKSPA